jgi:hypothetical protein
MTMIVVPIELEEDFEISVLTVGSEGGIGYWADFKVDRNEDSWVTRIYDVRDAEDPEYLYPRNKVEAEDVVYAIRKIITDDSITSSRFRERLIKAVSSPDGICDLDVEDCDVLIQVALFDEVVYG